MEHSTGLCHFKLYLFNEEYYFFDWNNWEIAGGFIFLYDEIIDKITSDSAFNKDTLYFINLYIERSAEDPEMVFDYDWDVEIVKKNQVKEVSRIVLEVRSLNLEDCNLLAAKLRKLVSKLRRANR